MAHSSNAKLAPALIQLLIVIGIPIAVGMSADSYYMGLTVFCVIAPVMSLAENHIGYVRSGVRRAEGKNKRPAAIVANRNSTPGHCLCSGRQMAQGNGDTERLAL